MKCGLSFSNTSPTENILQKRKRCSLCTHTKDRKVAKYCSRCSRPVCPEHSITTITCNECYELTENLKLQTLQLPLKNFFSVLSTILFVCFVQILATEISKALWTCNHKQLFNNKERKLYKEIVVRVKVTCKSNRGQNDPCYALK